MQLHIPSVLAEPHTSKRHTSSTDKANAQQTQWLRSRRGSGLPPSHRPCRLLLLRRRRLAAEPDRRCCCCPRQWRALDAYRHRPSPWRLPPWPWAAPTVRCQCRSALPAAAAFRCFRCRRALHLRPLACLRAGGCREKAQLECRGFASAARPCGIAARSATACNISMHFDNSAHIKSTTARLQPPHNPTQQRACGVVPRYAASAAGVGVGRHQPEEKQGPEGVRGILEGPSLPAPLGIVVHLRRIMRAK